MQSTFSDIGQRLAGPSGIQELMDDCGTALTTHPDMRMLGGGQPAAIPEVQQLWRARMHAMLDEGSLDRTLLNYDPPGGNPLFREAFAAFLNRQCGWEVTHENIAVMPSSQSAFFLLFNLLAGQTGTTKKRILFPLLPEYIGYANQALSAGQFTACLPRIVETAPHEIKYHVDFDQLRITPDIAAMCVSCPTNPTGNVLTQNEFDALVSFVFNLGCGALTGSTLLKLINEERMDDAAQQFMRWNHAGGAIVAGLTRRREAEAIHFQA